jgi:hypothetical protein
MRAFLIFTPYILIPLLLALFFSKGSWKSLSYLISGIIILIYPFVLFWIDDYLNPPPPGPRCGNMQMSFLIGNTIVFLPIALMLQFVFNYIFCIGKSKIAEIDFSKDKSLLNNRDNSKDQ